MIRFKGKSKTPNNKIVVLEFPPQKRTIVTCRGMTHLPFPYTVFVIEYEKHWFSVEFVHLWVFARRERLNAHTDYMCHIPLPNMGSSGWGGVCMGHVERLYRSLNNLIDAIVTSFWCSQFTGFVDCDFFKRFEWLDRVFPTPRRLSDFISEDNLKAFPGAKNRE